MIKRGNYIGQVSRRTAFDEFKIEYPNTPELVLKKFKTGQIAYKYQLDTEVEVYLDLN